jgi:SAM-dependent methyltransferase
VLRKPAAFTRVHPAPSIANQDDVERSPITRTRVETAGWPDRLLTASPTHMVTLHTDDGYAVPIDATRWHRTPDRADESVLDRVVGSVLDIGSGPGRIVTALAARGHHALGIDINHQAVAHANRTRPLSVVADVFGHVPRFGSWHTALLLDGNLGIGGDVHALLTRVRDLVRPDGRLVVETATCDGPRTGRRARVVHGDQVSDWFDWAVVPLHDLTSQAPRAGWRLTETWTAQDRWFSVLEPDGRSCPG